MIKHIRNNCFFLLLLIFSPLLEAQEPHFQHFDIEDGLPSNEIYHVIQDSKGYMWFATNHGVSRFDGYSFENFDLDDGLPDNTIFDLYEDYKGRIWFLSFSLKLTYYYEGDIYEYEHNDSIINSFYKNRIQNKQAFHVDSNDNIYLGIRNFGLMKLTDNGNVQMLNSLEDSSMHIYQMEDQFLVSRIHRYYQSLKIFYTDKTIEINQPVGIDSKIVRQNNDFIINMGNQLILSHSRTLYSIKNSKIIARRSFQDNVIWVSKENENRFWVSTHSGLFLLNKNTCEIERKFLTDHFVTSVLKDREGSYWFTSRDEGVFYTPNLNVQNLTAKDGLYSSHLSKLAIDSTGSLWIAYNEPWISKYDNTTKHKKLPGSNTKGIYDIEYDVQNDRVYISSHDGFYMFNDEKIEKIAYPSPLDILMTQSDTVYLSYSEGFAIYDGHEVLLNSCHQDSFCMRITSLFNDKLDNSIYLGGLDGLWKYKDGEYHHMGKEHQDFYYRITDIGRMGKYLVISTRGAGIIFYSKNQSFKITQQNGLISNSIKTFIIKNHTLWAATNKGISRVNLNKSNLKYYSIFNITSLNGLPYPQVNDIELHDSVLYAATSKGLTYFPYNELTKNTVAPKVYIKKVQVNGQDTAVRSGYKLTHNESFVSVDYVGLAYRNKGNVQYKYRLKGLDTNWNYTTQTSRAYPGLAPGQYHFTVFAQNEDGVWSREPAEITFYIQRPFWKNWWFFGLVFLVVSGLIILTIHTRLRMIRRRNELMQDINEYKQKILRQQMNPHFIFNTLNSIQYFLLDEDTTSSLTYLTKFAKLMRIVLDNSQYTFVPIEDEIRGLDLYLELEALRFEESFEYEIIIDERINTFEYKIPALMLQPYVENSIRHGLLHKKEKGFLQIKVRLDNSHLICIIEDNGIGREKAEKIKMSKGPLKKSLGSKITEDRIKVLNSLYSDEIDIKYVDLTDANGKAAGTRVEIRLPFVS